MTCILVADKLHPSTVQQLSDNKAVDLLNKPELTLETLPPHMPGVDVLVVRSTKVNAAALQAGDALGLVIRAGAGVNTIDVHEASLRGVYVANCPGKNAVAVAELAVGLMLAADRRIPDNTAQLQQGRWNKKGFSKSRGIKGRTLGIVGVGSIGTEVVARALPFEMNVIAWSRSLTAERAEQLQVERVEDLLELARRSDIVSVHVALTPDTRQFLGKAFFEALRPGTIFINTSRAEVVDSAAMRAAVESGRIVAGLDVFDNEPGAAEGEFHSDIAKLPNVIGTHHIGASTDQAEQATGDEVVRIVENFMAGAEIPNCVNLRAGGVSPGGLVIRHQDRVGVLASVLSILKEQGYNVQEMSNQIFEGDGAAACARIMTSTVPAESLVEHIQKSCEGVFHVTRIVRAV